jgi:hypothetical protein
VGAKACLQGSDRWEWISHWLPTSGQQWAARVACCADKQTRLDCTLLLCQEPGYEEAWAVVTDLPPQQIHGRGIAYANLLKSILLFLTRNFHLLRPQREVTGPKACTIVDRQLLVSLDLFC